MSADLRQPFAVARRHVPVAVSWEMAQSIGRIVRRKSKAGDRFYIDIRPLPRIYSRPTEAGPLPFTSEEQAKTILDFIRMKHVSGMPLDLAVDLIVPSGASHILRRADAWLEHLWRRVSAGERNRKSIANFDSHVRTHWGRWEGVSVHAIKAGDLQDWRTELSRELAPGTVKHVLASFHSFLSWLYDREEISRIPPFPAVRVQQHSPSLLTRDEQDAVLGAISEAKRGIYLACTDLALRGNEARALYGIDYEAGDPGWAVVRRAVKGPRASDPIAEETKTGRIRTLPVSDRLAAWIAEHRPRARLERLMFPSPRGGTYSEDALLAEWRRASTRAGVAYVSVYRATRHSTATHLRESGFAMADIQHFLGHTTAEMTERYAQRRPAQLVRLVR